MPNNGYLYVLANSAMPDLVKVGKTNRNPLLRAQELSSTTGLPTPFIVVYEQFFEDCDTAESFVHTILEKQGYRLSQNREFFKARISEVIKAIMQASDAIIQTGRETMEESKVPNNQISSDVSQSGNVVEPWLDLWQEAVNYDLGLDDYIQDSNEALKLYKDAARLGCPMAFERIGKIYLHAEEDVPKALNYFKEGAKKGNHYCYLAMSELFLIKQDMENYHKCIRLFFTKRKEQINNVVETYTSVHMAFYMYIFRCMLWNVSPANEFINDIKEVKSEILRYFGHQHVSVSGGKFNQYSVDAHNQTMDWFNRI